jgi:hypothetical protein
MDQNPPSFYAYTMECSGGTEFWQLLSRLMAAAGRPLVTLHDAPASPAGDPDGVARTASGGQSAHCGHGLLFDAEPELIERTAGATRLLFLRDPRLMTPNYYRQRVRPIEGDAKRDYPAHRAEGRPATFAAFLASPWFERVAECYRRFANLRRHGQNVVFLRYEHAKAGWHAIAADIVTALKLPIDPALAASIAADTPPVRDHFAFGGKLTAAAKTTLEKQFAAELATMEVAFADVLAALGYAPHAFTVDSTPRTADDVGNGAPRANRAVPSAGIFDADPVLHVRLHHGCRCHGLPSGDRSTGHRRENGGRLWVFVHLWRHGQCRGDVLFAAPRDVSEVALPKPWCEWLRNDRKSASARA